MYDTCFVFSATTAVNPRSNDGGSPIPSNVDTLPLPLTPLVLPPPVPEPVCEIQSPALVTMAQPSPQPQSVDSATHVRRNQLPSLATSSSSSGELHSFIASNKSSLSATTGSLSSTQELLQGHKPVQEPPQSFQSVPQPPVPQSTQ